VTDASSPTPPGSERDPVDRALGSLDHLLDVLHDNVLRPIILGGRFVAYGFIATVVSIVLITATLIALTRLMNVYLFSAHEWATYWLLALVLTVVGMVIWRNRHPVRLRK
jgi:hypothetical protein